MSLLSHNLTLKRRLDRFENKFLLLLSTSPNSNLDKWLYLEGLLSQTWQCWCQFSRAVIIDSCLGSTTATGLVTTATQPSWITPERISYEARCAVDKKPPKPAGIILSHREITWGDVNKIVDVVTTLKPQNSPQLLSGFGCGLLGPKHLQIVRNACAHVNKDTVHDVQKLKAYYFGKYLKHPVDIANWSHLATKDPSYIAWTSDIRTMADLIIQ